MREAPPMTCDPASEAMVEELRAAFQKWAAQRYPRWKLDRYHNADAYVQVELTVAWEAWKAALAAERTARIALEVRAVTAEKDRDDERREREACHNVWNDYRRRLSGTFEGVEHWPMFQLADRVVERITRAEVRAKKEKHRSAMANRNLDLSRAEAIGLRQSRDEARQLQAQAEERLSRAEAAVLDAMLALRLPATPAV